MAKEVEVKARVTVAMRAAIDAIAARRGEGRSVIVREAINEYLTGRAERHEDDVNPVPWGAKNVVEMKPAKPTKKVSYQEVAAKAGAVAPQLTTKKSQAARKKRTA